MDDTTKRLLAMLGGALDQANIAYSMLVEHLQPEDADPLASDDPELCDHPRVMKLETGGRTELMCETCGANQGPAYINGG